VDGPLEGFGAVEVTDLPMPEAALVNLPAEDSQ
jgi:hypothetical protein